MKIFFGLLIIIFLAFSGYHLTFRRFRLPLFARLFYLTGTEFLFLGLLLGPQFLNILDRETNKGLEPLSALLLGWIGMLFGFQFEIAKLRRFPFEFLGAAFMEGLITFGWILFGIYGVLSAFSNMPEHIKIVLSVTLAAVGASTGQTGLALLSPNTVARSPGVIKLLTYISSIDGLIALPIFGMVFLFCPQFFKTFSWVGQLKWGLSASLGLVLLYILFLTRRRKEKELILVVIGMAVLTSGTASVLHFSPLLINFFVGFCLVNLSSEKERIFDILISVEKPAYLLLLVFLGVNWRLDSPWILLMGAGYCLCRLLGKFFGGFAITRLNPEMNHYPPQLGFGLLDMGGLSLAILLDFQQGFPGHITGNAVSVVLTAVICNNFINFSFLDRLLKKGE